MGQDASANLDPLTENINVKKTGTVSLIQLFTVVRTDTTLDLSQKAEKVSTQRRREEKKKKKKDPKKNERKDPPQKSRKRTHLTGLYTHSVGFHCGSHLRRLEEIYCVMHSLSLRVNQSTVPCTHCQCTLIMQSVSGLAQLVGRSVAGDSEW